MSGSELAVKIAPVGDHPGLVQRGPHLHAIIERAEEHVRVVREPIRDLGVEPPAQAVERGGKVPVVQRRHGFDARLEQTVHEPVVKIEPPRIDCSSSLREHAAPGDAEAIRGQAQLAHQRNVLREAAIVVAGDVAVVSARNAPWRVAEAVPDARSRPVGQRRSLDLIRRSRRSPKKVGGKEGRLLRGSCRLPLVLDPPHPADATPPGFARSRGRRNGDGRDRTQSASVRPRGARAAGRACR